jgi:hypothetical protein
LIECDQRLTNGQATYTELHSDRILIYPVSRAKPAGEDFLPNVLGHIFREIASTRYPVAAVGGAHSSSIHVVLMS